MRGHFCVCSSFHILFETLKLTLVLCQTVCVIDEVLFVLLPLHFIPVQVPSSSTSTFQPYVPSPKCYLHPLLIINICSCLHNAWTQDIISSSIVLTDWKYFGRYIHKGTHDGQNIRMSRTGWFVKWFQWGCVLRQFSLTFDAMITRFCRAFLPSISPRLTV